VSRTVLAARLGVLMLLALPVPPSWGQPAKSAGQPAKSAGQPAKSATSPPTAHKQSLPEAPSKIGTLRRNKDGNIVQTAPGQPASPSDVGPLTLRPDGVLPPEPSVRVAPQPLRGYGSRPEIITPIFDLRRILSFQDRTRHERAAARHQSDIDRIIKEESRAKAVGAGVDSRGLTIREISLEQQLTRIDRDVRNHEMEHYRTGIPYGALPEYWVVTGPLGKRYVVTGITRFDMSEISGDRDQTLRKFETIRRAALAPPIPSDVDRRIADELTRLIAILRSRQ
jgi:hypothetical protein